jgi:hypothetical protein
MKHHVYKTKDGEEVMTFAQWVNDNGTKEDIALHDAATELPSPQFNKLLNKYLTENNVETVTVYEDDEIIEGPTSVTPAK